MIPDAHLDELRVACRDLQVMQEAGLEFIYLPGLRMPTGLSPSSVDGLLCLGPHGGYTTRLFLAEQVKGKGANWSSHSFFGRTWWVCSWNHVSASLRPIEIVAGHLGAFR
jgi:hypothetical protein